jgi:hypothetical protein
MNRKDGTMGEYVNNEGYKLDWDSEIKLENQEFVTLPAGEYPFRVVSMERGIFDGSPKMGACNKVTLLLELDGGELGTTTIRHTLYLHSKVERLLSAFFLSTGLKKRGEPMRMNWDKVPGSTGMAKVKVRTYEKNGEERTINDVDRFLSQEEAAELSGSQAARQQPPAPQLWQTAQPQGWQSQPAATQTPSASQETQEAMSGWNRGRVAEYQPGKF